MRILIKNGHVVDPANGIDRILDIMTRDEKILAVSENIGADCDMLIDATGKYVLPGAVDMNAELCEPGYEYRGDIASCTAEAVAGGITSLAAMPSSSPICDNSAVVSYIKTAAKEKGYANVYPVAALSKNTDGKELTEVGNLKENGAIALSDGRKPIKSALFLRKALEYSSMFGLPVITHCEDTDFSDDGYINEGVVSARLGLRGISRASEEIHAARNILVAKTLGCGIHLTHISTRGTVEIVRRAKKEGIKVTCDTAPQYFSLTDEETDGFNTDTKINPPLRTADDIAAVTEGIKDGTIDAIASSHSPCHTDEKRCEFAAARFGMSALKTALPASITHLVKSGIITMADFVRLTACNPAKILGLQKGALSVGSDADIAIWNIDAEHKVDYHHTPFNGKTLVGIAEYVLVNGELKINNGELETGGKTDVG